MQRMFDKIPQIIWYQAVIQGSSGISDIIIIGYVINICYMLLYVIGYML